MSRACCDARVRAFRQSDRLAEISSGRQRLAQLGRNGKLSRSNLFDEIYVQPVSGDDGVALGAALYRTSLGMRIPNERFPAPLFGPRYTAAEIETVFIAATARSNSRHYEFDFQETCAAAANLSLMDT